MPTTRELTVYQFDELDERAKERARDWFRGCVDETDLESTIEDCANIADALGVNLRQREVKLMGGGRRLAPQVLYSVGDGQGDGACFEGSYKYKRSSVREVREYAPQDVELHRIARELADVQRLNFYQLTATVREQGRYFGMEITVERNGEELDVESGAGERVADALRDFASWIYRRLQDEWDYQHSDETVDENIMANEYEFTADGERRANGLFERGV